MNWRAHVFYLICNRIFQNWNNYFKEISSDTNRVAQKGLMKILVHAQANVPYYTKKFNLTSAEELSLYSLPVLNKDLLRTNFDDLLSRDLQQRKWSTNSSGGSTGTPVTFCHDTDYREWTFATEFFYYQKFLDVDLIDVPKVILWGSPRDLHKSTKGISSLMNIYLRNIHLIDTFHLTDEKLQHAITVINNKRPKMIRGFSSALYLLSKYVIEKNLKIHKPEVIISAAESLRPFMRDLVEEVFDQKVFDYYGSREVGAIAGGCRKGKYHIFNFNNWMEVVDENDQPVKPGEEGRLLISTLHNYSMPLLRYEIGDIGVQGNGCDCGVNTPTLEKIMGRVSDYFVRGDKALVHGQQFTRLFYFMDWIAQFQVLQKSVDQFEIYYVCLYEKNKQNMEEVNKNIREIMASDCEITWIEVDEVPRTPQGKLMFTRSLVHR